MRESPRIRRLRNDLKAVQELKQQSSIFDFQAQGDPPDRYVIRFSGQGLYRRKEDRKVLVGHTHVVLIRLGAHYPRLIPEMKWRSPIFHPNIATNGAVCLGGYTKHWVPSLGLDDLCLMLWDMIRFANYDVGSPYNREAANWITVQKTFKLPVDHRQLRDQASREALAAQAPQGPWGTAGGAAGSPLPAPKADQVPVALPATPRPQHGDDPDGIVFLGDHDAIQRQQDDQNDDDVLYIE